MSAKIVDEASATIPGRGDKVSIYANHINICKFKTREDTGYKSVVAALKKFSQKEKAETPRVSSPVNKVRK